ncbi:hypothetical protein QOT17_002343 [Balamuthia mandrillaris]
MKYYAPAGIPIFFGTTSLLLSLLFVALRLDEYITWSWYYVFAPAWISMALFNLVLLMLWPLLIKEARRTKISLTAGLESFYVAGAGLWVSLSTLSFLLFLVLIPLKAEGAMEASWVVVAVPFWTALLLLLQVDRHWPFYYTRSFVSPASSSSTSSSIKRFFLSGSSALSDDEVSYRGLKQHDYRSFFRMFDLLPLTAVTCSLLFSFLEALRAADIISSSSPFSSQFFLFLPLWYLTGVLALLLLSNLQLHAVVRQRHLWSSVVLPMLIYLPFVCQEVLICLKLEGAGVMEGTAWMAVLAPTWLVGLVLFFGSCCSVCLFCCWS